jgi:hypothetical protein
LPRSSGPDGWLSFMGRGAPLLGLTALNYRIVR